jgi:hypothetical protein
MEQGKVCTKCGEFKDFNEYYKQPTGKYGYTSKCKKCENKRKTPKNEKKCIQCEKMFIGTPKKRWCSKECRQKYTNEKRKLKHSLIRKRKKLIIDDKGRQCVKCEVYKSWDNFWSHIRTKSGYDTTCIECKKSNYNHELNRKRGLVYRLNNPEKERERFRRYRQTEQGKESNYKKSMKRRSYKHHVIFSNHQRKDILDRDKWTCQCCGIKVHDRHTGNWNTPNKAHIDHIIPISKSGNSEPDNLQVLCRTCNLSKSDKLEYIKQTQINS